MAIALILLAAPEAEARPASSGQVATQVPAKAAHGTLLRYEPLAGLPRNYRARAWRILYVTRDYRMRHVRLFRRAST